ncbi:DNA polymerase III subunit alpha [Massilimicrobiota timonensis]|uniref:DNA polymerase III subunit alpha n=1 Tax=Massilimicrobiota timonensis TaxID=1776392 RepID=A0A1Y4T195_9FIRM|nr:DNA polymerase III subunit alpha [Massilimicrobiota timonensis]OUQ35914.1 DNA polymerase III subunit alpha [Massilimicrobiota timonensis]
MFGHLQVYSGYSFQQSTILIKDLVLAAKEKHLDALALTDKNNMFGAMEFSEACLQNGIKPILGMEASVLIDGQIYPFILLAIDDQGYFDLVHICCEVNLSSDRAIALDQLALYHEHLYVISGLEDGIVERHVAKEMEDEAIKYMRLFQKLFHDHYYIMLQNHHLKMQEKGNERMMSLARYVKVKVICSNEVRYLKKQDALAVDLLQASAQGITLDAQYQPLTQEKYLKDEKEMERLFPPEIIEETRHVCTTCKATIPLNEKYLPTYPVPHQGKAVDYLRSLCHVGLKKRFQNQEIPVTYQKRLLYELKIIHEMGFDDYFLIVWDYVRWAKVQKIQVGPGRGSAAGSLVAYVLGITNIDPLRYDLLFERFLNPERVSMPDIDIDFQDDRRDEVIRYVIDKYGKDHAAQIVTFNTYGPRVAMKEMGKVMGVPLPRLELIAKMIPTSPKNKKTITQMYQSSAQFQSLINQDQRLKKIVGATSIIEHLPRNISTHAAGVILSKRILHEVVPLVVGPTSTLMCQYSKDYIETAGFLKMDFLALKNLTMLDYICKDIEHNQKIKIVLNEMPLDDQKTYRLISKADTFGVFQLESYGMRHLLRQMKPYCFDDIVAAIALFRPGPMENIPTYLKRRSYQEKVVYPLKELEPILKSTYGIMVYQEQMMQVAQKMAGFSLAKADILRKATSKKETELMHSMKEEFIAGCLKNGFSQEKAEEVFGLIEKFADYGFNKSHSVAYAYVAYQLAYLKANYPLYFFASILSNELSSENTKVHCIQECKAYHVRLLPPSVNQSQARFMVEDGHIRYSLLAIKNVGYAGYKAIIEERQKGLFKDIYDFMMRMENSHLSKKMLESLVDAGALDEFGLSRQTILKNLDAIRDYGHLKENLGIEEKPVLTIYQDQLEEKLNREKAVLGVYLSMHPLELKKQKIKVSYVNVSSLDEYVHRTVNVVVQLQRVKNITDRKGQEMCFIEAMDETGSLDGVVFASRYKDIGMMLKKGNICLIQGRVDMKDKLSFIVDKARVIE